MVRFTFLLLVLFSFSACAQTGKDDSSSDQVKNNNTSKNYGIVWEVENLDTASIEYKKAIKESNAGLEAFQSNDFTKAIEYFDQAIKLHPGIPKIYANRGGVYYETQNYFKALADYNKALSLDSLNPNFIYNRGLVYKDLGQYPKAINDFEESLLTNQIMLIAITT